MELQQEVQLLREDLQNVSRIAQMASEDAQKVMLRTDNLEYEWLVWNDSYHSGDPVTEVEPQQSELQMVT